MDGQGTAREGGGDLSVRASRREGRANWVKRCCPLTSHLTRRTETAGGVLAGVRRRGWGPTVAQLLRHTHWLAGGREVTKDVEAGPEVASKETVGDRSQPRKVTQPCPLLVGLVVENSGPLCPVPPAHRAHFLLQSSPGDLRLLCCSGTHSSYVPGEKGFAERGLFGGSPP